MTAPFEFLVVEGVLFVACVATEAASLKGSGAFCHWRRSTEGCLTSGKRFPTPLGRVLLLFACASWGAPIKGTQKSVAKNWAFAHLGLQNSMRQRPRARIWQWSFAVCAKRQAAQKLGELTRSATHLPGRAMIGGARLVEFSKSKLGGRGSRRAAAGD